MVDTMSNAWKGGSTRKWRGIRATVLANNARPPFHGQCQVAIPGVCTGKANCVHHIHGRAVTGDDPRFLVAACRECNLAIGDPQKFNPTPKTVTKW